jgi:glycosyltransferase involved in cell wall biosynthesis
MYTKYFPPQYSGAAKQAISLSKYLREKGHIIDFVTFRWPGLSAFDTYDGFPVYRLECKDLHIKKNELLLWWNLFKLIRHNDYDIVHSHGAYYTNCIMGPMTKLLRKKSLIKATLSNNDLIDVKKNISGWIHYFCLKTIDACVAISPELRDEFCVAGVPLSKVLLLPNGVDTKRFRPSPAPEKKEIKKKYNLPENQPLFLAVGVFDERKNIGWLLKQWVKNEGFGTNGYLLAVGPQSRTDIDGHYIASLKRLAKENNDKIGIMNHIEHIEIIYRAADVFLLPSTSEGLPNVVLEAMASGLPTIGTNVSGSKDLIVEDITGCLFAPNDAVSLNSAIKKLMNLDPKRMGVNSRAIAQNQYSLDWLSEQYEILYEKLIQKKDAATP